MEKENGGKLKAFIDKIKGIKNFRIILVTLIIAVALIIYSTVMTARTTSASKQTSASMTADEQRLSSMLSGIEGAGDAKAMITEKNGEIVGVLVIAEGADDPMVRIRLINAVSVALGVDRSVVNVFGYKK